MTKIVSIGTAVPDHRHEQEDILQFMQQVYALPPQEQRKLRYLYQQSGIDHRYSVIPDYSRLPEQWEFYPSTGLKADYPDLEKRMAWYRRFAPLLSAKAIRDGFSGSSYSLKEITHLITVSCTGMSAPGLDLQLMELLELPPTLNRSSINFMGCYAAIHGLKQADAICRADPSALVMVVCTELCTLHFQEKSSADNMASSLLFGDGAAAMLLSGAEGVQGVGIRDFYSEVIPSGRKDMSWELASTGFLMTLSGYVPDLIESDFLPIMNRALLRYGLTRESVEGWCIHPGGKRILRAVEKSMELPEAALAEAYGVLRQYGNMSSPTILYVLKSMLQNGLKGNIIGAAFGPGLTMETCWLEAGGS